MSGKKRKYVNKLNDLTNTEWLKFQKSWFVHNPPPRRKDVIRHPAKFPETLVKEFIEFFTKRGGLVLDPMAGTGSTLVAALRCGRNSIGIELNPQYADIARRIIEEECESLGAAGSNLSTRVITGDAAEAVDYKMPQVDYVITSPPYWDMLHASGAQTQRTRRESPDLDVTYSDDLNDLGNIKDYDAFLQRLVEVYSGLKPLLRPKAYMTIIVKNIKKKGKIYPLAWDLARYLSTTYELKDEKIWCQDNIRLAPYGMGNAWVSNTFHHYCLQFRNQEVT
jgi:DNA modification methylase